MKLRSESIAAPTSSLWTMSPARSDVSIRSWTSVSIRSEPGRAEHRDLVARQVALLEQAVADRVVDVVVDVGDAVDDADDLALERLGLLLARVREDAVADLVGQVQPLGDPQRLLVVPEADRRSARAAPRRARPRRRGRTAGGPCRGRARSPRRDPRSAAARGRRRARSRSSRACGSCACGSGRRPGR